MRRLLLISAAFFALIGVLIAWNSGDREAPADFTYVNRGDHKTLDPGSMSWLQDIRVADALWEGLYTQDPQTLLPVPGVADKLDIDPSGKVYTFHLRHDAKWSNGDPVTAGDFLFSWRRILEEPKDYTELHYYIQGAREYSQAYSAWVDQADSGMGLTRQPPPDYATVGVKALDDQRLQVTLRNPTPFFLSLCVMPPFFPLHEASMKRFAQWDDKSGRVSSYDDGFTRPPYLVSNGPYRLQKWVFKRKLRMVANEHYWNRGAVHLHVIDEPVIEDSLAALRAYLSGQVDWLSWVEEDLIGQMRRDGHYPDLHTFPGFGTYFYVLNCLPKLADGTPNPLADPRVRRALAMAIDKRPIVEDATHAGQPAADNFIPPGIFPGYPSPPGLKFDPAQARRLLAEAGFPDGKGFPTLHLSYNKEMVQHADIALIVRGQWQANLGITVDIEQLEIKVFAARLHARDYSVARASWIGDYPDPTTFSDKFKSNNDDNNAGWANDEYDRLCATAEAQTNQPQRLATLAKAEGILLQDAAIIPLYYYVDAYMFSPKIRGIPLDPRDMVMFQGITLHP